MRSPSRRVLIGAVAALVVVFAVWLIALWLPRSHAYSQASADASAAEAKAAQLQSQLSRLKADARQEPLLQAEFLRLQAAIPDDPDLAQFILDLNDAATQSGVNLLSINPSPPTASAAAGGPAPGAGSPAAGRVPPTIKVSMNINGGYFQVLDFLDRLDTLSRLIVVDTLALTHSSGSVSGPELTVAISARMFTTKQPPIAPSTGVATTTTSTTVPGATTTTAPGATTTTAPGASTTTSTP